MGRNKLKKRHLPPRMRHEHGCYFYADSRGGRKPWVKLGPDYAAAILRYAQHEAATTERRDYRALVAKYQAEALPKLEPTTRAVYSTLLKKPLKVFGAIMPDDITQQDAYRYMDERQKAVGRQEMAQMSIVLTFGVMKGWLRVNPLIGMKYGKKVRRKRYITDVELSAIVAAADAPLAQAIRFLHYTALRSIDARRIRWGDWKADGLHVRISKSKAVVVFERTPQLEALMAEMKQRRVASMHVIADAQGRAWTYRRLYAAWQRVATADANLHDLRRKRLTDLAKERGLLFAQTVAAHTDPKMTQTYVVGVQRVAL